MILMNKSLKRSDDIMRSLRRNFEVNNKSIDGVLDVFYNKIGQGYLLKTYQSYNKSNDLVIWMFIDSMRERLNKKDKEKRLLEQTIANHLRTLNSILNFWVSKKLLSVNPYNDVTNKPKPKKSKKELKYFKLKKQNMLLIV